LQKVTILLKFLFNLVPIKSPMIYFGIWWVNSKFILDREIYKKIQENVEKKQR
jgi:hypothetical protein